MTGLRNVSTILLFVCLIASCATDRIHRDMRKDLECKTIKTRYDYGKNIQIREINSDNRKFKSFHATLKSKNNSNPSKNITGKGNSRGSTNYVLQENQNQVVLTDFKNEQLFFPQTLKRPVSFTTYNEINKLQYLSGINNAPSPMASVNNQVDNSIVLKRQDEADLNLNESTDESIVSVPDSVKINQTDKLPFQKREAFILMMAALAGLIPFTIIKSSPKFASDISFWAAMNPWKTRFMFAGVNIALGTCGFLLGEKLADNGMHFSALSKDLLIGSFLFSTLLYPTKATSIIFLRHTFLKQKAFDLALAVSGFMLMVNVGNDPGTRASFVKMVNFNSHEQQNVNLQVSKPATMQLLYQQDNKLLQQEQTAIPKKEKSKDAKIGLTFLAILASVVLGLAVALAACGLACNGMEGLAALTGLGGGVLVVFLATWMIKSIWHPKQKNRIKNVRSVKQERTYQV